MVLGDVCHSKGRHVAFIFRSGNLVSIGRNYRLPIVPGNCSSDWTVHAEVDALRGVHWKGRGKCVMVVVRIKRDGSLGMSKPCSNCRRALAPLRFKSIWYSTEGGIDRLV